MLNQNLPEPELLKVLLQPLLEDFKYWFERSRTFLENENVSFLESQQQSELLARVKQAQQEVSTAQLMFQATGGQVGIDMATLVPWHQLVTECWKVAMRFRSEQAAQPDIDF
jgi:alkylated DNA repair dioxygenase AlkB